MRTQQVLEYVEVPRTSFVTQEFLARCPEPALRRALTDLELTQHPALWTEQDRIQILLNALTNDPDFRLSVGIVQASIPEDVHAVAPGDTLGDFVASNMIVEMLYSNGLALESGSSILDFGCSSGRVVRTLAAYQPAVSWLGCDPRVSTVEWARRSFQSVDWFVSDPVPPLPEIGDRSLGGAFAISIWSHFSEVRALEWLVEMRRVIADGGWLLVTTHGLRSVHHQWRIKNGLREERAAAVAHQLRSETPLYDFAAYPSANLDSDLEDGHWGISFSNEPWWNSLEGWRLLDSKPGRLLMNQDVYLLVAV